MSSRGTVVIDCFPEAAARYREGWATVAIDVIRATTTVVTAVAEGRRVVPVPSLDEALDAARRLPNAILMGELDGDMPPGFELNNSPCDIEGRTDVERPVILLSSSGTRLICATAGSPASYVGSLRNLSALAGHLAQHHDRVALIGAGSRGSFREEDQLCCAWMAGRLLGHGFEPDTAKTASLVRQWHRRPLESIVDGDSARYLERSGQLRDLAYVLAHVDDLDLVCRYEGGEVSAAAPMAAAS